jgi:hypothetical protein
MGILVVAGANSCNGILMGIQVIDGANSCNGILLFNLCKKGSMRI